MDAIYSVRLTPVARRAYEGILFKSEFEKVDKMLLLLDTVPEIGRVYDPEYDATRPPFPTRVVHAGHYSIYYTVDVQARTVVVFAIESQRADPMDRFGEAFADDAHPFGAN